jgi:H/ACA ribonucleoprotein complex subunit 4
VTGVLPVTLEESRKIVQALLYSGKEYVCVMKLHGETTENRVNEVLKEFEDTIYQRPPLRASVKRQLRTRRIFYIEFLEMDYDVGEVLGCGAHMQELRRTRAGPFVENGNIVTLHDVAYWFMEWQQRKDEKILRKFIQPMEEALALVSKIYIRDSAVDAICHGANLTAPGVLSLETEINNGLMVAVFSLKGEAVALAKAVASTEEILNMEHGVVAKTERVLMNRGTYPKRWKSGEK